MERLSMIQTRRYVAPEDILSIDSTFLARVGSCELRVRSFATGESFSVAADLADIARLLTW